MSNWFKNQAQSFPDDEEMLLFGGDSSSSEGASSRDDKWMRTTSVLLTLLDHFNASYHPMTSQKGLEGMQRSEISTAYRIPCGVELANLLQRCKAKKGEEWRSMEGWIRRELAFTVSMETPERMEMVREMVANSGETEWLETVLGTPRQSYEDEMLVCLLVEGVDVQQ